MDFYTIDSRVKIDKDKLIIKKLTFDSDKKYWFHSFILLLVFIALQLDGVLNGKPYKWIGVLFALMLIYPHLERIFKILFITAWGNTINLNDVIDIKQPEIENELETKVVIKVKSGRRKEFIFRTTENQADKFIVAVQEISFKSSTDMSKLSTMI